MNYYDPNREDGRLPYAQRDLAGLMGVPLLAAFVIMIASPVVCLILLWKLGVYTYKRLSTR